ncbi:MAG: glycosyltransferase family 2 protein [Taibaiella sp.]|nr:glycosyltransferase family 2 protein [Taibaiella sp.]
MPDTLSILIITYNRPADLLELLRNLSTQQRLDEVLEEVLILNNASGISYKEVEEYIAATPRLKATYTYADTNWGVARGRNILMQQAKGSVFLTIDDDMVFPAPDAIYNLGQLFHQPFFKDANTGIITFRVIYFDTKEVQLSAFPHKQYAKYVAKQQFLTAQFAGGANIMKREVIAKAGLFPVDFQYGMEEYDLLYRALSAGYTLGYDGSVTVEHKESPLGRQAGYKKLQMQWVNKSKVAWRYLPFVYFVGTAVAWSFQYLKVSRGHIGTWLQTWLQILRIPFTEKRHVVSKQTIQYLRRVEARLWF